MKTETAVNLGIFAIVAAGAWWIINQSKDLIGDDPYGFVGGDDFSDPDNYPGWWTRWESWQSGNPEAGVLGIDTRSTWGQLFDWDPLGMWGGGSHGGWLW